VKKMVLLVAVLLLSAAPALAQTVDGPRTAEEELVPWYPETGYDVMNWYQSQGAGQYSTEPLPGYVSWGEYCWYDPDDVIVLNEDGNIPMSENPCGGIVS
jgi:hypothetical protein